MIFLSKKEHFRIYIKKKSIFDIDSFLLFNKLKKLNIPLNKIIIYHVYDFFKINRKLLIEFLSKILLDPVTDIMYLKKNFKNPFFECYLNNSDNRDNAAIQCIKILNPYDSKNISIKSKLLIEFIGINKNNEIKYIQKIKNFIENDYSYILLKNEEIKKIRKFGISINNFINCNHNKLRNICRDLNLSMDLKDLLFIKKYFHKEKRNPTEEELKILDTYWSDHCRHITFFTQLEKISFNGILKKTYKSIFNKYMNDRKIVGSSYKPINLMDLTRLPCKIFVKKQKKNITYCDENNACIMMIDVFFTNKKKVEKWYLCFKNETHNHPTEIDPFNGAYTCIGGAIRDPLSIRSFVYQGLRLSGIADPKCSKMVDGKLPQNKICIESANGFSSYGNQIGLSTTHVNEIYHEGYRAKKMEVGMTIGAVPVNFIKWEKPINGDIILLIGGITKKEGIGDANNSSKIINNYKNIRKKRMGDPIIERKIQRLFRKKEITFLIKKCNDLGAGGISVALCEIHDSVEIYLDKIPIKKNNNLYPIDIALSESQERMVVVIAPINLKKFIKLSREENLIATPIAKITKNKRIIFLYKKKEIFNIKKSFLNTGGYKRKNKVIVESPKSISPFYKSKKYIFNKTNFLQFLSKLNIASQLDIIELFDSTVGGTTVLMPFGGKYQMTPSEGSVQKIPVLDGSTTTVSIACWGFHPEISTWSPFHGGSYAILECISKIVAIGGNYKNTYLSFQEYYQKLGKNPINWGKPFSSLLGAYHAQMSLGIVCIGGKDSMSGTYKNKHVPPTLISFGVTTESDSNIISPEFKKIGNKIYLYHHVPLANEMPNFDSIKNAYNQIYNGIINKKIISVKTIKDGGISIAIAKMSFGNQLGVEINYDKNLLETHIGSLIIESSSHLPKEFILIGKVTGSKYLKFNGISISINMSMKYWLSKLDRYQVLYKNINIKNHKTSKIYDLNILKSKKNNHHYNLKKIGYPNVFIPIFPGTNGEYESIRAFKNYGAKVNNFVFKNLDDNGIIESISYIRKIIKSVQIIMICGGFSAGDEPDGSAKFIISVLQNKYIKDSINNFLNKDGLILGICNGFQALIKSGLLPYGKICLRNRKSPSLVLNKVNKHISQCVHIKIISDSSPWLNGMKNKIYTFPISHGEGRFYAEKKICNFLFKKNQVAAQYVNINGEPSLEKKYNPNGSTDSIESLLSNNGKIYGRMTHPERIFDTGILKNIPHNKKDSIFMNAIKYFL
ncbi:phosphoribosylformylglycinamidine synthase [Blattabacterium cuenoti]|uniref:phosphoribosylformylglycinamidine synthase n=1 Tax=Blattabacterium cuenoti TaxID=1653831 RepID=UPI00163C664E|nr:phosphoribosylformylglycinamidine synthase [Blattabacterium cuenoti]